MTENQILFQDRTPDWASLKVDVEKLYSNWETILLSLYKINVNSDAIINFGTDLDTVTSAIQNEDKVKTLNSLAKLYSYIPIYSSAIPNNAKISSIYKTKSSVMNAYVLVEQDDFTKINEELKNAEQNFIPILNDMNTQTGNQTNINKAYILIKELQGYNVNTSKEVFYIKYKNLLQNINNIE